MKQRFWGLRGSKLHALIWGEACVSVMIFGYNQGSAGSVLGDYSFETQFPITDTLDAKGAQKNHNASILGTVVALYTLLGAFGALSCTFLCDALGRRKTIFIASAVQAVGAILQASSFHLAQYIVGRIFLGLGTGAIIATVSLWQAEVSKTQNRGRHVSAFGIFVTIGLALAFWVAFGMSYTQPSSVSWRFVLVFPVLNSLIVCTTILYLPESPRWLCKVGRWEEARELLSILHDEDSHSAELDQEFRDIEVSLELSGKGNLRSMFRMGPQRTFHRVLLAVGVQILLQMSGVNSIIYYEPTIYVAQLGFSSTMAAILSASAQLVPVIGAFVSSAIVDRFGRRKLMLISVSSMAVCFACLAGLVSNPDDHAALKAAVFFLYLYLFVYVIGFLGVPFLYASEIAPAHLRGQVFSIATAVSWLFNFLVAEVTPVAFADIGFKYFIVYMCINIAAIPIIYFFFPETGGRSLEEIDEIFAASHGWFDLVSVAKILPKSHLSEFLAKETGVSIAVAEHLEQKMATAANEV